MTFVGIDVSKSKLTVAMQNPAWKGEVPNTPAGRRAIVQRLAKAGPCRVVVEATATYSEAIATVLAETPQVEVMVANPRATKNFAKALDQRGKTDGIDGDSLMHFAAVMPFQPWKPRPEALRTLRRLTRRRQQLVEQRTAEKVRLKEMRAEAHPDPFIVADLEDHIRQLGRRIARLEKEALKHVRANRNLNTWRKQLCSIPGVGNITAMILMAELGPLIAEMDARQLTAYAGLDPQPWQSGTMDARRRISKRGNRRLRTALYLASWNVVKRSPEVRAWRQRLIDRGKAKKLADIAVARRLLHAIAGMKASNTGWDGRKFYDPGHAAA